jgi:single-strand DNA-binding protein
MKTNYIRLIGHMGNDIKVITAPKGKIVSLRLATSYKLKTPDAKGNKYGTEWHDVLAYDSIAKYAESNLVKGSRVMVEGFISYRTYLDRCNHVRYVTKIVAQSLFNLDR